MFRAISGRLLSSSAVWLVTLGSLFTAIVWQFQADDGRLQRGSLKHRGVSDLSGKTDAVKVRIKESAGALTDNDKLRKESQTDRAVGKVEQAVENVADTVQVAATAAVDKVKE